MLKISVWVSCIFVFWSCTFSSSKNNENVKEIAVAPDNVAEDAVSVTSVRPDIYDISELYRLLQSADRVIAYNFNDNNANSANVECDDLYTSGHLCRSAVNERVLTPAEMDTLIAITTDTTTYDGQWSGIAGVCYVPHAGFGFFRGDSLVAQVSVCFLCHGVRTRPYYKSEGLTKSGYDRYKVLLQQLGLRIVDNNSRLSG